MPTVSRNIFWSTLTSVLQLYTGSVVFIVLAKLMSVEDFGILSFGFSLSALAVIAADFGFSLMVIKEYPEHETSHKKYISNSLLAKASLSIICAILFFTYISLSYEGDWFKVGAIYIFFAIITSFTIYLQSVLKVQNRFHKYTESTIVYAIAVTVVILGYAKFQLNLFQLVGYLLLAKVVQLVWTTYLCRQSIGATDNFQSIGKLIKRSWSFGLHTVLGIFYFMIDTQIISLYLGATDVALYQSVFRIILILLVFSDIVSNVLLPYLSYKYHQKENISELVSKIFLYMLIIGCSLFLAFTSFKIPILELLYTPEYVQAAVLVLPFSIVVILRTSSALLGNILTISNRQVYRVLTVGVSLVVSIVLNLICIPKYGILSAAWVSVVVHVVLFGMYYFYSQKEIPSIKLASTYNLIVLAATGLIYAIINHVFNENILVTLLGAFCWIVLVYLLMRQGDNLNFLQKILKEKGAG